MMSYELVAKRPRGIAQQSLYRSLLAADWLELHEGRNQLRREKAQYTTHQLH